MNSNNDLNERVLVSYTNFKGETDNRLIRPLRIWFGSNEWHPEPQWLLDVIDLERDLPRTFAMNAVHNWINNNDINLEKTPLSKKERSK